MTFSLKTETFGSLAWVPLELRVETLVLPFSYLPTVAVILGCAVHLSLLKSVRYVCIYIMPLTCVYAVCNLHLLCYAVDVCWFLARLLDYAMYLFGRGQLTFALYPRCAYHHSRRLLSSHSFRLLSLESCSFFFLASSACRQNSTL